MMINWGRVSGCALALFAASLISGAARGATTYEIQMTAGYRFVPDTLTVQQGDSVHWTNDDTQPHTTTSGTGCVPNSGPYAWDSGLMSAGHDFGVRFNFPQGDYSYLCQYHCSAPFNMLGRITVRMPTPTEEKTWGVIKKIYR